VSWSPLEPERQPHIGINAHLLSTEAGYRRAGIHQYIEQVLRHLPAAGSLAYTVYTRQTTGWGRDDWRLVSTRLPTAKRLARIAWEQVVWPALARRDRLALMHSMAFATPRLAPCPVVVTVYDLSFIHYPDAFPAAQRRYLMAETAYSCGHAARLIAISESGCDDLERHYGVARERIDIVTPGVGPAFRQLPATEVEAFRRRRTLPDTFILHVGTLQPRKNIPVLIDALARLDRPTVPLVLVGGKGWFYETIFARVAALGLAGRVHFAGYVDDEELPLWYNAAAVLAFPSLYEGFGMPIVEALACGTPVVAARASSLPQAGGPVARYFAPNDPDDLAARLAAVLDDPTERRRARQDGPTHAARFSWARAGRETAAVYARALGLARSVAP
jgi:glycosyltransferase involved in cell wall biosynthesis